MLALVAPHEDALIKLPVRNATGLRFSRISFAPEPSYSRVAYILQDDQGFMWFGTNNGIERYDGYSVRAFQHDPANPNSLNGSAVNSFFKDRSGKLWIGVDQNLDRFDPVTETFKHYQFNPSVFQGNVTSLSQDREGKIWAGTIHGLNRIDPATGEIVRFRHDPQDPDSLSTNIVQTTLEARDGTFWVATVVDVEIFDRATGKVTRRIPLLQRGTPAPLGQLTVTIFEDHSGAIWVISKAGLALIDRREYKLRSFSFADEPSTALTGIRAIYEDDVGNLWLGGADAGILKLGPDRKHFIRYQNNPSDPESLSTNQVVALCGDREGNIWVGTTGGGVNRFASRPLPFARYRYEPWNPNSLPSNYTSSVFEDSQHNLWVGSIAALTRINRSSGNHTFYHTSDHGLSSNWVLSMAEDRSGNLWFGTLGKGLNRLDPRTGKFKVYMHDPADRHSLSENTVYGLFVDRKGTLWASTGDGIDAFDPATDSFRTYRAKDEGPVRYNDILQDRTGTLWLGTWEAGLRRLDPATGKFTIYRQAAGGLSSNEVEALWVDQSGIVWAGTLNGLNRLNPATGEVTVYYQRDGLPSSSVQSVLADHQGNLWMSTSDGLSCFNPATKSFRNYYVSDGLLGNEFYNYAGAYESPDGEMFFNSYAGVIAFFPDKVIAMDRPYTPPVVITDFQLFGKPVAIGQKSPLQKAISFTKKLVLTHADNIFSVDFAALSYSDPQRSRYRYRLEGLYDRWNEVDSHHRYARFTTLPAGDYVFRVEARTNRGAWNQTGASVQIRILPPWWNTWWFQTVAAILIVVTLASVYEWRLHQFAAQFNMRLEERVGERTRIARELHDTLLQSFQGLMLLFQRVRNLLPERPLEAMAALDDALVRADHAITEGRDAVRDLRASTVQHNDLAQAMTALGHELGATAEDSASGIRFRVLVEGTSRSLHPILRDEVYCVAREALRNAFQHAHARHIEAEISYGATVLRLRVRDDGSGIDPKILEQGFRSGHWGLPGMHERAQRIGAQLSVWSRPGVGTELELSVPAALAYGPSAAHAGSRLFRRKAAKTS